MKTRIFYHGSPISKLKRLEPRLDTRLGLKGVFVADEPFGPMMFALLPNRAKSTVKYVTKKRKFVEGYVITPKPLNKVGWLYSVKPEQACIVERKPGRYFLNASTKVVKCRKVTKEEVLKLGWKVTPKTPK